VHSIAVAARATLRAMTHSTVTVTVAHVVFAVGSAFSVGTSVSLGGKVTTTGSVETVSDCDTGRKGCTE
jgi:hypothetical protein